MATYVNFLRLTELATGEGSGTWGTTTNQSLELIGEALGYATQQAFGSDADATTTVADGASDPARAMYYKITSAASLTATRTLTIAPNTISRVMFIENATSGSQSIAISQGSGASVTIATGKTAVVYLDGAGATAAVVDAMAGVDPGVTDTLTEVLVAGNTSGGTNIELSTTDKVQFRDAAIYLNSSVDGQLDIVADTEIQIAATTVDLNGDLDVSGTALVTGVLTTTAATVFNGGFASNADSTLGTDKKVQFRDSAIYINSSADGQLDLVADTEIQIAATTIDVNGTLAFDSLKGTGATTVTNILDEDNMGSDSATAIATQQSIKAYVDSQVGSFDTLAEVLAQGNTTGSTDIAVDSAQKVQFRDAAIYINSSVDGQLDIVADTEIQIAATTVDLNGNLDVSGTALVAGVLTTTAATVFNGGFASNADSTLGTDKKVQFRDAAIYLNSSVDGQLDIVADTEIQIAATTIDIDGAVDISSTLAVGGIADFADHVDLPDNKELRLGTGNDYKFDYNGSRLNVIGTGDTVFDITGDFYIDADGADVIFQDGGTSFAEHDKDGNNYRIKNPISDGDILIQGTDSASVITALTLDMSEAGAATFSSTGTFAGGSTNFDNTADVVTLNGSLHTRLLIDTSSTGGHQAAIVLESNGNQSYIGNTGSNTAFAVATGDLTLDVAGDINLDSGGSDILLKVAGTSFASFRENSGNFRIKSEQSDKDMLFMGNDGGGEITALTLDMSDAGAATFNAGAAFGGSLFLTAESPSVNLTDSSTSRTLSVNVDDNNSFIRSSGVMLLQSGGAITALTLDASQYATFANGIALTDGNLVVASGHGIDFSATAGSGTSELLDDYEEGAWTPVTSSGSWTVNSADYTKVGNMVTCRFKITATATISAVDFTGLPFTVASESAGVCGYQNSEAGEVFSILVQPSSVWNFRVSSVHKGVANNAIVSGMFTYQTTQ
jgi:hypothetical protein